MKRVKSVLLDNEAVQSLLDVRHAKHRRVLAAVEAVLARGRRHGGSVRLVVPTTVRVEAGWDRRPASAAIVNRLRIVDAPLDRIAADRAADIRTMLRVSVANAHLAAVLQESDGPFAVLTSDVEDVRSIVGHLGVEVNVVAL
ncbi:hypothetical protein [Pseudonocardia nigra]|uniref:hypothetical protein n=1 Tax=Pseudonocardia nigra TaxID=1921578 RepID=UPI001C5CC712|nr:hypothetical protein [Pseudonocardia nigra]